MIESTQIQSPSFDNFTNGHNSLRQPVQYGRTERDENFIRTQNSDFDSFESVSPQNNNPAYGTPLAIISSGSGWFSIFSFAIFISSILFGIILYSLFRVIQIRLKERKDDLARPRSHAVELLMGPEAQILSEYVVHEDDKNKRRWEQVIQHSLSQNSNDWRLAIIEADIILEELITKKGYQGSTLGEKMKQVKQSDMNTIELAWEAHKVRNDIAHKGSEHELTEAEVRKVVALYKRVFTDEGFI